MADFIRRDTAELLQDVPAATKETIIGALEVALEHRDWEEDRDDVYELLLRADTAPAVFVIDRLQADRATGLGAARRLGCQHGGNVQAEHRLVMVACDLGLRGLPRCVVLWEFLAARLVRFLIPFSHRDHA